MTPILLATASSSKDSLSLVRVVRLSSFGKELFAVPKIGISLSNLDYHGRTTDAKSRGPDERYCASKVGAWAQAVEFGKRMKGKEIVGVPVNPGNLKSDLFKDRGLRIRIMAKVAGYPAVNGAYTQLYAGLSEEVAGESLNMFC